MKKLRANILRALFSRSREETSYVHRRFRGATDELRARLETIGAVFLEGYHSALEHGGGVALALALNKAPLELRGFAFEGAAMGLGLLDRLTPWRANRVRNFLRGAGDAHAYMIHVGVGWIWARAPFGFRQAQKRLDPLLGWLAFDGWGFHDGFFHWEEFASGGAPSPRLAGYERRVFDQGLGRSLWFANGGNVELISQTIARFAPGRRADLWSGIGLAATYAGIVNEETLIELRTRAGDFRPQLAQGAAFASKARQRAGNLTAYTDLAAGVLCEMSAAEAARLCDSTLENLPAGGPEPAYEIWRQRIQSQFQKTALLQTA